MSAPVAPGGSAERARDEALAAHLGACLGAAVRVVSLDQIEGGFSRHTYRCVIEVGSQERRVLALRAEAPASVLDTDLAREFKIVQALAQDRFHLPAVIGFEPSGRILGQRFMTTGWADGVAVNPWRTKDHDRLGDHETLCRGWVRQIAELHAKDPQVLRSVGVDVDADAGSYVAAEVAYWVGRIRRASFPPGPLVEFACQWLEAELPQGDVTTIVHGDLRIGNMLVAHDNVSAFLDWEMAAIGDWRADLGYTLMPYHAGKLLNPIPPSSNGLVDPRRFLRMYEEAGGRKITDRDIVYFTVLGCVKMIGILCTGIDSYMARRSSDPRLAWLNIAIPGLTHDAVELIEEGLAW